MEKGQLILQLLHPYMFIPTSTVIREMRVYLLKSTYLFSIFKLTYLKTLNEWPWTQYLPFLVKLDIKKYFKTKMWQIILILSFIKFMFSKKATKMDKIFTANLMVSTYYQIDSEDFFNFCGLLSKRKLYQTN